MKKKNTEKRTEIVPMFVIDTAKYSESGAASAGVTAAKKAVARNLGNFVLFAAIARQSDTITAASVLSASIVDMR